MASKSMDYSAALRRYEERYDALKAQLQTVGFIGQGSIQTRHLKCGKPTCRCYDDPDARHSSVSGFRAGCQFFDLYNFSSCGITVV